MSTTETTDTVPAPESAEETAGDVAGTEGTETNTEPQSGNEGKASREAARYRTERNDARAELADANARIERMQRAEAERIAGNHLSDSSDLFALGGRDLADLLNDEGDVDAEAVDALAREIIKTRPGLRKYSAVDRTIGLSGPVHSAPTWDALFKR